MYPCKCQLGEVTGGQAHANWCEQKPVISKPIEDRDTFQVTRELPKSVLIATRIMRVTYVLTYSQDNKPIVRDFRFDSTVWDDSAVLIWFLINNTPDPDYPYTVEFIPDANDTVVLY
jgi:hypothetical protein